MALPLARLSFPALLQSAARSHKWVCKTRPAIFNAVNHRGVTGKAALGPQPPTRRGILSQVQPAKDADKAVQLSALIPQRLRNLDPIKNNIPLLVILHGLLGSANNWRSLLGRDDAFPGMYCCSVDLRNHGRSQHRDTMTYPEMCRDVLEFAEKMGVQKASLIGHSMGGKVAMSLALRYPERVSSLVVVDIAPVEYEGTFMHQSVLNAMSSLDLDALTSASEARELLAAAIPEPETREFVLTNLQMNNKTKKYQWKVNVNALKEGIAHADLAKFPVVPGSEYRGPVLFIAGRQSKYVQPAHHPRIRHLFPNAEIVDIDTGHWPHAQAPSDFLDVLNEWYSRPELQGLEEDHALLQGL